MYRCSTIHCYVPKSMFSFTMNYYGSCYQLCYYITVSCMIRGCGITYIYIYVHTVYIYIYIYVHRLGSELT